MSLKENFRIGDFVFIPSNTEMFKMNLSKSGNGYTTHYSRSSISHYGIIKDLDHETFCNVMIFDRGYWLISPKDLVIYEGDKNDKVS